MEFAMKFDGFGAAVMTPLGAGRKRSRISVGSEELTVRQGWAFSARVPSSAITGARRSERSTISRGAHGWRGRWLVNGSGDGLVTIDIDPRARGSVIGFPIHIHELTVSVEDPDGLVAALS